MDNFKFTMAQIKELQRVCLVMLNENSIGYCGICYQITRQADIPQDFKIGYRFISAIDRNLLIFSNETQGVMSEQRLMSLCFIVATSSRTLYQIVNEQV